MSEFLSPSLGLSLPPSLPLTPLAFFSLLSFFPPSSPSLPRCHCAHTVYSFPGRHRPNQRHYQLRLDLTSQEHPASAPTSFPVVGIETRNVHDFPAICQRVLETPASFFVLNGEQPRRENPTIVLASRLETNPSNQTERRSTHGGAVKPQRISGNNLRKPVSFLHLVSGQLESVDRLYLCARPDGPVRSKAGPGRTGWIDWTGSDRTDRVEAAEPGRTIARPAETTQR